MEEKLVRVPFDVELAKKISSGNADGRVITKKGDDVRIVCFDVKGEAPILGLIDKEDREGFQCYDEKGKIPAYKYNELELMLEIPEYMTFKDGDVLTYRPNGDRWCIFIYRGNDIGLMHNYVTYDCDSRGNNILTFGKSSYISTLCELSTEFEKQKLIDALKKSKDPRAKEYLKRFFGIEKEEQQEPEEKPKEENPKHEFNAGQPVIGVDGGGEWRYDLFSHYKIRFDTVYYVCSGRSYKKCLPYEGNEHLLGTTDNE